MRMYVLYFNPSDYPDRWVLRGWTCHRTGPVPDEMPLAIAPTRLLALSCLPSPGLCRLQRSPEDEAQIMEIWL